MWREAVRKVKKAPSRFTLITRRHSAVAILAKPAAPPRPLTPALAKQESTRPSALTVSAKARSTAASSATSQRSAIALPPWERSCFSAAAFLSSLVPQMQTDAPARASPSAMPRPMPLLPPVTSATLPVRSNPGCAMAPLSRERPTILRALARVLGGPPSPLRLGQAARLPVADELHVTVTGDGPSAVGAAHLHRAFPVARAHVQLLVGQPRRDRQLEAARGVGEPPAGGIFDPAPAAAPGPGGLEAHAVALEHPRAAARVHHHAGAEGIGGAVPPAEAVVHQLAPVLELEGEPVPARQVPAHRGRAPLAVHPREPLHLESLAAEPDGAARGHARERVVVGGIAGLRPLACEPALALEHRRLGALQVEIQRDVLVLPAQMDRESVRRPLRARVRFRAPILHEDPEGLGLGPRQAERAAADPCREAEAPAARVRHREVGEIGLAGAPVRIAGGRVRRQRAAEERELKAQVPPAGGPEIAGPVPPLD